jgi:two-component system cell cycle sensor histidine kinase/response regulator CckA
MSETFPLPTSTLETDLLRLLFAETKDGLIVTTADGGVVRANAAAEQFLRRAIRPGTSMRDVLGEGRWHELTSAHPAAQHSCEITPKRVGLSWQPLRAYDPEPGMLIRISAADVTAGLHTLGVMHDLGNVFAVIQGAAEAVIDGDIAMLGGLVDATRRGREMLRTLLDGEAATPRKPPTSRLLDAAVQDLRPAMAHLCGNGLCLEWLHAAPGARVAIDAGVLERILLNLVANARDAMAGHGVVKVETALAPGKEQGSSAGSHAVILVRDDGPGIAPDVLAHLGEPFFTTKPAGQGTGLGLATVRGMLAQAGGWLTIDSAPGQGCCAGVHLPLIDLCPQVASVGEGTRGTVLLVEDEAMLRVLAARALTRAGWAVVQAASGEAALEWIVREAARIEPQALVTDLALPGMTGQGLAHAIRSQSGLARLPVVIMTAAAMPPIVTGGGAKTATLTKPFEMRELNAAVESLVASAAADGD